MHQLIVALCLLSSPLTARGQALSPDDDFKFEGAIRNIVVVQVLVDTNPSPDRPSYATEIDQLRTAVELELRRDGLNVVAEGGPHNSTLIIDIISTKSAVAGFIAVLILAKPEFDNQEFYLSKNYGLAVTVGPDAVARLQSTLVSYTRSFANSWLQYKDGSPLRTRTPTSRKHE